MGYQRSVFLAHLDMRHVCLLNKNVFFFFFFYRLIHGGQLLNGLAGPTMMSAGPYLSTTWFAPDQRATATAVASLFSYLGGAASFIVGPLIVPAPNDTQALTTISAAVSDIFIRDRIQLVMYAGTKKKQEPLRASWIDIASFRHHVSPVKGQKYNQAKGSKNIAQTPKTPIIIFITASLNNGFLGLICLTDSEN